MKKLTLLLFVFGFSLTLSVTGQSISSQKKVLSEIDEFIIEQMEIFHVPGLSACIIIGDSVVWNNNFGFMNLEDSIPVHDSTLFNVFSIGKTVTTACAMQLWDEQLLGLEQNVNDIISFQITNPYNDIDSITPRMIMSHTSSIRDWLIENYIVLGDPTESLASFLENYLCPGGTHYVINNYYNLTPGTNYHYSNVGIALLGHLIEPLTGLTFNQYARASMLNPLEMDNSAWFLDELNLDNLAIGYTYSGGNFSPNVHIGTAGYPGVSFRTTALELANFNIMLLNGGLFNGLNILSSDAIDSMSTVQNPSWASSYGLTGLGMFQRTDLGSRTVWGHNGGSTLGYAAQLYFCEEENSGVVIVTNSEQYVDTIVEYLFDYALLLTNISEEAEYSNIKMSIYPNPSNNSATISFEIFKKQKISLSIYCISGQRRENIFQGTINPGLHNYTLDANNIIPGIYFVNLATENDIITKKLIIE
jgi:CubicO group peptidase (beta-lactamase class C family)